MREQAEQKHGRGGASEGVSRRESTALLRASSLSLLLGCPAGRPNAPTLPKALVWQTEIKTIRASEVMCVEAMELLISWKMEV